MTEAQFNQIIATTDQLQTLAHRAPDPLNIRGRFCDVRVPADDPAAVVPHGRNWRVLGMLDRERVVVAAFGVDSDVFRVCPMDDLSNLY